MGIEHLYSNLRESIIDTLNQIAICSEFSSTIDVLSFALTIYVEPYVYLVVVVSIEHIIININLYSPI